MKIEISVKQAKAWWHRKHRQVLIAAAALVVLVIAGAVVKFIMEKRSPDPILAVVNGHTHRPRVETKYGILFVNPGSAGAPRYGEHATVALLQVCGSNASADLIRLQR